MSKFKVGDKVIVVTECSSYNKLVGYDTGKVGVVSSICGDCFPIILDDNKRAIFKEYELELVTNIKEKEEPTESHGFSIGEKVYSKEKDDYVTIFSFQGRKAYDKVGFSSPECGAWINDKNGSNDWLWWRDIEKWIDPKYKVGFKFDVPHTGVYTTQIVKVAFNRKRKEYYYMCFDLEDGYARSVAESEINSFIKNK